MTLNSMWNEQEMNSAQETDPDLSLIMKVKQRNASKPKWEEVSPLSIQLVAMDIFGPLPETAVGNRSLLSEIILANELKRTQSLMREQRPVPGRSHRTMNDVVQALLVPGPERTREIWMRCCLMP